LLPPLFTAAISAHRWAEARGNVTACRAANARFCKRLYFAAKEADKHHHVFSHRRLPDCRFAGPWLPSLLCERLDPFGMLPLGIRSFASASGYQD